MKASLRLTLDQAFRRETQHPALNSAGAVRIIRLQFGGESEIRTRGADNCTTAFEFQDSRAGACRSVVKRVLLFAIFLVTMRANDAPCHAVLRGSFAIPFAILLRLLTTFALSEVEP